MYTHGYPPVSVFCCNVITGEASAQRNQTSSFFLLNIRTARERAYLFFRVASDAADDDGGTTGPIPRRWGRGTRLVRGIGLCRCSKCSNSTGFCFVINDAVVVVSRVFFFIFKFYDTTCYIDIFFSLIIISRLYSILKNIYIINLYVKIIFYKNIFFNEETMRRIILHNIIKICWRLIYGNWKLLITSIPNYWIIM